MRLLNLVFLWFQLIGAPISYSPTTRGYCWMWCYQWLTSSLTSTSQVCIVTKYNNCVYLDQFCIIIYFKPIDTDLIKLQSTFTSYAPILLKLILNFSSRGLKLLKLFSQPYWFFLFKRKHKYFLVFSCKDLIYFHRQV